MEWSVFLKWLFIVYALYYLLCILYDIFLVKSPVIASENTTTYDLKSLMGEEAPKTVDNNFFDAAGGSITESRDKNTISDKIQFDLPPQGQGIPLKEFLTKAKEISNQINF